MDVVYDLKFCDYLLSREEMKPEDKKILESGKLGDGYVLPENFADEIREEMKKWNLFREHGTVFQYYKPVNNRNGIPQPLDLAKIASQADEVLERRYKTQNCGWWFHNYEEEIIECNYDIHRLYKSESCEPKFVAPYYIKDYQGNPRNYDCEIVKMPAQTVEDYEDCLNRKI